MPIQFNIEQNRLKGSDFSKLLNYFSETKSGEQYQCQN